MLKLLAFVLPLGLDSFAVAAAIVTSQDTAMAQRLRVSLIFVLLEGEMPLIGLGLGASSASAGWAREKRKSTAGMRHPRRTGRRPRARPQQLYPRRAVAGEAQVCVPLAEIAERPRQVEPRIHNGGVGSSAGVATKEVPLDKV